jgi:S-adenosylmethionine synthetase
MNRYAEAVLNGHPDKFCDLVADRLIRELYKVDPEAYAQIEVSVWSDILFLTGGAVTQKKADLPVREIIVQLGREIGYTEDNAIDVRNYKIHDHVCWITDKPQQWTHYSNDQCIVNGYAGYDVRTHFLPPEQFLVWRFREALVRAQEEGLLRGQGPDGKILVSMKEEHDGWKLETLLVTLQQQATIGFPDFVARMEEVLHETWIALRLHDDRWKGEWSAIRVLINPNGPLLNGGSDGDNGQTGRKLVMDHYGPRIPIGGGALYGKDLAHIDRLGSFQARRYAVEMVQAGAKEAMVRVCFAPGMEEPLSVDIVSDRRPIKDPYAYFSFSSMRERIEPIDMQYDLRRLGTFYRIGSETT